MAEPTVPALPDADLALIEGRAVEYARLAGDRLMAYFRQPVEVEFKGEQRREPVSVVDRELERLVRGLVERDFPRHGVLGEEGTQEAGQPQEFLWVVDPVDGTTNFLNHLPFFACSIGVLHRLRPVVGAIFVPVSPLGERGVYHARRGGGTFLDDRPLRVSEVVEPATADLASVPAHYHERVAVSKALRRREGELRTLGSIAAEMGLVASGSLVYAVYGAPHIWDVAAGVVLVQEAGGVCLTRARRGEPWHPLEEFDLGPDEGRGELERLRSWARPLVCGNPALAAFVAHNGRPRQPLLGRMLSLLRRP